MHHCKADSQASDASARSCWSEPDLATRDDAESVKQQPQTLYVVLGVSIMASAEVIRSAYRKLARLWHPDRHCGDDSEDAKRKFQEIQGAYEVLSDRTRRHEYDLNLLEHLDVEEYLSRYQGLILKCQGLGMMSRSNSEGPMLCDPCDLSVAKPRLILKAN